MFRIKICGVTHVADARAAVEAGADAIGLNFYPGSRRYLEWKDALPIVEEIPSSVLRVGVFVNTPRGEIDRYVEGLQLDAIQLHGDEDASFLLPRFSRPVIRALRCSRRCHPENARYLDSCREQGTSPAVLLMDADREGVYGGSGNLVEPEHFITCAREWPSWPLILAGGLRPENVAAAIAACRPAGVDTASGVESASGRKSPQLLHDFISAARTALAACGVR